MGCGTGPLRASNAYQVTLTFDTGAIAANDPIYIHFQSALDFILEGLSAVGASGYSSPQIIGGNVTSISVEVDGPLTAADAVNFNRAFNRLLWGVRYRRGSTLPGPPPPPIPSGRSVTPSDQNWTDENT
jgi:hypothetical protein